MAPEKYYTLLDLTESLKSIINKTYTGAYWIKAEITKLNYYKKSGHCYPDLVEKVEGKIKAQMRATIWGADYRKLNTQFLQTTGEPISEGMTILFKAKVSFHPVYGLSLNIIDIEPSFTLGEMAKEKAATLDRLKKEGLFDQNRKLPFPLIPKSIAVISVDTSKGFHDFKNILENNERGYCFHLTLFPALLQGDKAVLSICEALDAIHEQYQNFDVVTIIRGGGGDVGLNCYDSYTLTKEIADFPLPVITGIGHSTNETVTEMVAHQNKITPTDVAYLFIKSFDRCREKIDRLTDAVLRYPKVLTEKEGKRLNENMRLYKSASKILLNGEKSRIEQFGKSLAVNSKQRLRQSADKLEAVTQKFKYRPMSLLSAQSTLLKSEQQNLERSLQMRFQRAKQRLMQTENTVRLLDPKNILKRGYSFTRVNGNLVTKADQLKKGDQITTHFAEGSAESIVEKTNKK